MMLAFSVACIVMVCLVFAMPDIDYDSYFRFQLAYNMGFSLNYVRSLIWLPVYQFIIAFVKDLLLMRLFSVVCILLTGVVLARWHASKSVATATSVFFLFNPFIMLYGSQAMSESLNVLLTVVFLVLFLKGKHVLAVLSLTCGVLTAYSFWIFIPFMLFFAVVKRRKSVFIASLLPVSAIVWWGYINYVFAKEPLGFLHLAHNFYEAISHKLVLQQNFVNLLSFPIIFPISFVLPFAVYSWKGKITDLELYGKTLLIYFIVGTTLLIFVGQILGYVFGWSRYFIPLIPAYIMLGCKATLTSKYKWLWTATYFLLSFAMTVIQAYQIYNFKLEMLKR